VHQPMLESLNPVLCGLYPRCRRPRPHGSASWRANCGDQHLYKGRASDRAHCAFPKRSDSVRDEGQSGISNGAAQKGCSVVSKQLVIRPFLADFDLRGRPPVYKTAALPIELRRRPLKGKGTRVVLKACTVRPGFRGVGLLDTTCCCPIRTKGGQHGATGLSSRVSPTATTRDAHERPRCAPSVTSGSPM